MPFGLKNEVLVLRVKRVDESIRALWRRDRAVQRGRNSE
jgi:hypothetical protein